MELELPCQRNCLECFHSQIFGTLGQGKITFELGLSNLVSQKTICKDNKKAHIYITIGMKIKNTV